MFPFPFPLFKTACITVLKKAAKIKLNMLNAHLFGWHEKILKFLISCAANLKDPKLIKGASGSMFWPVVFCKSLWRSWINATHLVLMGSEGNF